MGYVSVQTGKAMPKKGMKTAKKATAGTLKNVAVSKKVMKPKAMRN